MPHRPGPRTLNSLSPAELMDLSRYVHPAPPSKGRFPAQCLLCGQDVYVAVPTLRRLAAARGGAPREHCAHSAKAYVTELPPVPPLAMPPGMRSASAPRVPLTEPLALEVMRLARYEPLEPYSGRGGAVWRARCLLCQAEVWAVPASLASTQKARANPVRTRCSHRTTSIITPSAEHTARAARARSTRIERTP